jgi:hypothetical protein
VHPPCLPQVKLVGLTKLLRIMSRSSVITTATAAVTIPSADVPRFRAVHEEIIKLDQDFGATFSGGHWHQLALLRSRQPRVH